MNLGHAAGVVTHVTADGSKGSGCGYREKWTKLRYNQGKKAIQIYVFIIENQVSAYQASIKQ